MNRLTHQILRSCLTLLVALTLVRCGGDSSNSIHLVVNGQTYEMELQNSQCQAGAPSGAGLYNLPLTCSAGFTNTGGLADAIIMNVTDVRAIEDQLGLYIPISPSLLIFNITIDGVQLAVTSGGAVFSKISNIVGGETCFQFQITSTTTLAEGSFCAPASTGY